MQSYPYEFQYDSEVFKFVCSKEYFEEQKTLIIQRETCRVKQHSQRLAPLAKSKKVNIHLIMGILTINRQPFLTLVKDVSKVGTIVSFPIYHIKQVIFIAFRNGYNQNSYGYEQTIKNLDAIKQNIINDNFYFCYSHNLTVNLQKRYENISMNTMFFWNQQMLHQFRGYGISKIWMIPIIQGFVRGFKFKVEDNQYTYTLISRRSKFQSGTRYLSRGANQEGYVANFVQCEEIYCFDKIVISWIVLRGSVPLYWSQTGIGAQVKILDSKSQSSILKKHFDLLSKDYSHNITVIDLLSNKAGGVIPENQLQKKYESIFKQFFGNQYMNFDLNDELSKNKKDVQGVIDRWVQKNTDRLCGDFFAFNYSNNLLLKLQKKYIRINCLDCLDRTNVICFKTSEQMFKVFDDFLKQEKFSIEKPFFKYDLKQKHREAWLDNGDRISLIYSGTTSVASYLTRGEKSNNFMNSLGNKLKSFNRFYQANISDAYKQQCFNWVLRTNEGNRIPYFQNNIRRKLNETQYCEFQQITLSILTWNCAQVSPKQIDLKKLISPVLLKKPDILIICLQQIIQLNTFNVLLGGNKGGQNKWIQGIQREMHLLGKKMNFIGWKDMIGVLTLMFVDDDHFQHIGSIIWSQVKTGWKGNLGNKGAVGLSFKYDDSVVTILNCHLEAGEGKLSERLGNIQAIHTNCFSKRQQHLQYEQSEFKFLIGDLNFRLDLSQQQIKQVLNRIQKQSKNNIKQSLEPLLAVDELLFSKQKDSILSQYSQAPIQFLPSYKYIKNTNNYDYKRVPSWCDRILFQNNALKLTVRNYERNQQVICSDHKPIFGIFQLLVRKEDLQKRQLLEQIFLNW